MGQPYRISHHQARGDAPAHEALNPEPTTPNSKLFNVKSYSETLIR